MILAFYAIMPLVAANIDLEAEVYSYKASAHGIAKSLIIFKSTVVKMGTRTPLMCDSV